ncbi:hypothetical protein [Wenzhouxiangella sp. EGI_FJ10409]|uniref:hypothetical protein n=1 Tax=Wenzhouxiangella sp. EGI_FJ10409 TaxID=3243767 RepID=UPI0035D59F35
MPDAALTGGNRTIARTPIYDPDEVLALVQTESAMFWTRRAGRDAAKWSLDISDISQLVAAAIQGGRFQGAEWCQQSPEGPWAACDSWSVTRSEWIENAGKSVDITYYLKYAISRTGSVLLIVSSHPEHT